MERKLNAKVKKLFEKANRKLRTAGRLSKMGEHDDALSRAYYAMYHAALALVMTRGGAPTTHAGLLVLLSKEFVLTEELEKRYFDMLSEAKELRESGDYEPFFTGTEKKAEQYSKMPKHSSLKSESCWARGVKDSGIEKPSSVPADELGNKVSQGRMAVRPCLRIRRLAYRVNFLYLIRCGWSASVPRRLCLSAS